MRAKITNSDDGDLYLGFSSDYGETYYTDENDCPVLYIGSKQSFQDSAFPDGPLRHRALWVVSDFFTAASTVYVMVNKVVDIYVAVVHCFGNSECAGSLSTPPSSPPTPHACWSAAYEVKYLTGYGDACGDKTVYDNRDAAENACASKKNIPNRPWWHTPSTDYFQVSSMSPYSVRQKKYPPPLPVAYSVRGFLFFDVATFQQSKKFY